ncbi:hypothetical protein ABZ863_19510 [Saccharomonospora sp. NPDC046836]|uniref:hypothetical protein n=1 Tax=Saccharomonospora sp. NPDC046836 TaxID=3156921 RepID=UPI0033E9326A
MTLNTPSRISITLANHSQPSHADRTPVRGSVEDVGVVEDVEGVDDVEDVGGVDGVEGVEETDPTPRAVPAPGCACSLIVPSRVFGVGLGVHSLCPRQRARLLAHAG